MSTQNPTYDASSYSFHGATQNEYRPHLSRAGARTEACSQNLQTSKSSAQRQSRPCRRLLSAEGPNFAPLQYTRRLAALCLAQKHNNKPHNIVYCVHSSFCKQTKTNMLINNLAVAAANDGSVTAVSLDIMGEPQAQNGYSVGCNRAKTKFWTYNKHYKFRQAITAAIKTELATFGVTSVPFKKCAVEVFICYYMANPLSKDIDNMQKLVQDAIQKAIISDDKYIFKTHAEKRAAADNDAGKPFTTVSVVKI